MSVPFDNPDVALLTRIRNLELRLDALGSTGNLANSAIQAYLGAQGTGRGIKILDASAAERVRLGVDEAGKYGISAGDGTNELVRLGQLSSGYGIEVLDGSGAQRVRLGQSAGAGLYGLSVNDGTRDRVQVGQITGGGYGLEVRDAAGNLIADTTGLAAVAAIANQASFGSQTYTMTNDTAWHDVPNSTSGTFALARAASILALGSLTSSNASGTSITDILYRLVVEDGSGNVLAGSQTGYASTANGWYNMTQYILYAAAAGTFQIRWQYAQALAFGTTQGATVKALISSAVKFGG